MVIGHVLAGTSDPTLSGEVFDHREEWTFLKRALALGSAHLANYRK